MADNQEQYGIFSIHKYKAKAYWLRLGTAFPNSDGSFNLSLGAMPLPDPHTGIVRLHMRKLKVKNPEKTNQADAGCIAINPFGENLPEGF